MSFTNLGQSVLAFIPANNETFFWDENRVTAGQRILSENLFSDSTQQNFRKITFSGEVGDSQTIIVTGLTFKNYVEGNLELTSESVQLNDDNLVETTNYFKPFTAVPQADVDSLKMGFGDGYTFICSHDGSPTTHRIVINELAPNNHFTVYALLYDKIVNYDLFLNLSFPLQPGLDNQTTTTPTFVYAEQPVRRLYLKFTETSNSMYWSYMTGMII